MPEPPNLPKLTGDTLLLAEGLQSFHSPKALHNKSTYFHRLN